MRSEDGSLHWGRARAMGGDNFLVFSWHATEDECRAACTSRKADLGTGSRRWRLTPRLQRCIEAGDVFALFPLLKDWPADELRALLKDIEAHYAETQKRIQAVQNELSFKP